MFGLALHEHNPRMVSADEVSAFGLFCGNTNSKEAWLKQPDMSLAFRFFTITSSHVRILLVVVAICLSLSMVRFDRYPNVDEIAHLPSGLAHLKFGRFDMYRVNPPLVRTLAALGAQHDPPLYDWRMYTSQVGRRPEFIIGGDYLKTEKIGYAKRFFVPRFICVLFFVAGVLGLFAWTSRIDHGIFALLVVCYFCFSPNMLGNAPTILPDVGLVTTMIFCGFAAWRYILDRSTASACLMGIALGTALLTKLTALTLFVSLPLSLGMLKVVKSRYDQEPTPVRFKSLAIDALIVVTIAISMLHAGYLFEDSFVTLDEYEFVSKVLGGPDASINHPSNRFSSTGLASLPVPLPRNYVLGIDFLKYEVEAKRWSFLMGEWRFGSWPHYYAMTTLFKTPEATLIGAAFGLVLFLQCWWCGKLGFEVIAIVVLLGIPALVAFASISLQGGFNHHHRYVLMIYPVMFVLAAFPASKYVEARWPKVVAVLLCGWMLVSSFSVAPHFLTYFNSASGGPSNGWRLLGFSNIAWGQDLVFVDQWIKEHPECRPLRFDLDCFGVDGEMFGLPSVSPPRLPIGTGFESALPEETEWWIVSAKKLYNLPDQPGLEYLQQLEPVDRIAHSYHVYKMPGRNAPANEN
jgi:hypothetical protein